MQLKKAVRFLVLAGLGAVLFQGCMIPQWQREHLSDPIMRFDQDPAGEQMDHHFYPNREGSSGGYGGAGGGCGC